jgi:hypothetical protein
VVWRVEGARWEGRRRGGCADDIGRELGHRGHELRGMKEGVEVDVVLEDLPRLKRSPHDRGSIGQLRGQGSRVLPSRSAQRWSRAASVLNSTGDGSLHGSRLVDSSFLVATIPVCNYRWLLDEVARKTRRVEAGDEQTSRRGLTGTSDFVSISWTCNCLYVDLLLRRRRAGAV